ncbi:MAG TPA: biotin--[acetyl-CoA-carboxylase] ligase [Burkholderiales bacterium]|nr:biotin--[acetyl-CoA-carboxylase] ligase [Burkholderiales bacterium]
MHNSLIPLLRELSDGRFHSGALLARQFGISRATVCNVLKAAESAGILLHRIPGRGYRLSSAPDWLVAAEIRAILDTCATEFDIEIVDQVDSTNAALLRAPYAAHRHCLAAETQYAGRGRRGRIWHSTLGGSLTCSVRWRFSQGIATLAGLSLATGVALIRTLRGFDIDGVQLKWPNDVLWQQRKLAGILIEVQGEANGPSVAVIGIGINLRLPAEVRAGIDQSVADLAEISGGKITRNRLLATLLYHLAAVMTEFEQSGLANLRREWLDAHAHTGKQVRIAMANGNELTGSITGLAENGALLLHTDDDRQIAVNSGEVHLARLLA